MKVGLEVHEEFFIIIRLLVTSFTLSPVLVIAPGIMLLGLSYPCWHGSGLDRTPLQGRVRLSKKSLLSFSRRPTAPSVEEVSCIVLSWCP